MYSQNELRGGNEGQGQSGLYRVAFKHKNFLRDDPSLCGLIVSKSRVGKRLSKISLNNNCNGSNDDETGITVADLKKQIDDLKKHVHSLQDEKSSMEKSYIGRLGSAVKTSSDQLSEINDLQCQVAELERLNKEMEDVFPKLMDSLCSHCSSNLGTMWKNAVSRTSLTDRNSFELNNNLSGRLSPQAGARKRPYFSVGGLDTSEVHQRNVQRQHLPQTSQHQHQSTSLQQHNQLISSKQETHQVQQNQTHQIQHNQATPLHHQNQAISAQHRNEAIITQHQEHVSQLQHQALSHQQQHQALPHQQQHQSLQHHHQQSLRRHQPHQVLQELSNQHQANVNQQQQQEHPPQQQQQGFSAIPAHALDVSSGLDVAGAVVVISSLHQDQYSTTAMELRSGLTLENPICSQHSTLPTHHLQQDKPYQHSLIQQQQHLNDQQQQQQHQSQDQQLAQVQHEMQPQQQPTPQQFLQPMSSNLLQKSNSMNSQLHTTPQQNQHQQGNAPPPQLYYDTQHQQNLNQQQHQHHLEQQQSMQQLIHIQTPSVKHHHQPPQPSANHSTQQQFHQIAHQTQNQQILHQQQQQQQNVHHSHHQVQHIQLQNQHPQQNSQICTQLQTHHQQQQLPQQLPQQHHHLQQQQNQIHQIQHAHVQSQPTQDHHRRQSSLIFTQNQQALTVNLSQQQQQQHHVHQPCFRPEDSSHHPQIHRQAQCEPRQGSPQSSNNSISQLPQSQEGSEYVKHLAPSHLDNTSTTKLSEGLDLLSTASYTINQDVTI